MTSAFVTPSVALTTSSFTRSLTIARPRAIVSSTHRTARMLGELPVDPPVDPPVAPEETPEPTEVDVPDTTEVDVPETSEIDVPETTEMVFDVSDEVSEGDQDEEGEVVECPPPQFVINARDIAAAREKFRLHETDSGSPEYQIATLTVRIAYLTRHLKEHPKDHACTRGLLKLVSTRRRLLKYVKKQDTRRFNNIVSGLGIRISAQLREL